MILLIYFMHLYCSSNFMKIPTSVQLSSVAQLCATLFDPMDCKHTRLPCSSPTPRGFTNSCPLSRWCHPTISSSVVPISSRLQTFPELVFSNESVLRIRWPNYWSFSLTISPFNEYSGLISFRMYWLDLFAVQGLSRVFSNTTVQKHEFFGTQPAL